MEISGGKLKSVVQHCIYEISTGKWKPGEKLPSVRKAEELWGVNRLTILSAYRELSEMGLVVSEDRRGYFVANQKTSEEDSDHKKQLDELFKKTLAFVRKNTDFEPAAVLKYFSSLAEKENEINPEFAFLECSVFQAQGHALEIRNKLNVAVLPLLIDEEIKNNGLNGNVRTLLTTGFHIQEVKSIGKRHNLEVVNVPIEVDPNLFESMETSFDSATIFELEEAMSRDIFNDVKALAKSIRLKEKVVKDVNGEIVRFLADNSNELILLSPRVWGRTAKKWQQDSRVHLIRFSIKKESWPAIIETMKLPFRTAY